MQLKNESFNNFKRKSLIEIKYYFEFLNTGLNTVVKF
jgi:hypothetical protein